MTAVVCLRRILTAPANDSRYVSPACCSFYPCADQMCGVQNKDTHPELRKYTEMLRTVAGSRVGSWLGLSAFNQQAAQDKAIADAKGVCIMTCCLCSSCVVLTLHVLEEFACSLPCTGSLQRELCEG